MNLIKDYYRRITERLPQGGYFTNFSLLFLVLLMVFSTILTGISYVAVVEAKEARYELLENLNYWQSVTKKHPNSPDAFFEAGYYALKLGDIALAKRYLDEALKLDPSFEKTKVLSEHLTSDL